MPGAAGSTGSDGTEVITEAGAEGRRKQGSALLHRARAPPAKALQGRLLQQQGVAMHFLNCCLRPECVAALSKLEAGSNAAYFCESNA